MLKAIQRTPHMLGSRVGMSNKSQDAEFNELHTKFTQLEEYSASLLKDTTLFRDSILLLITSQASFSTDFTTIFKPIQSESSLSAPPAAAQTLRNLVEYDEIIGQARDQVQPELQLIDERVIEPLKQFAALLAKVRKTVTKRDHKLVDFDRHNNSYNKLKGKNEKSLSDEKNLFKVEQDLESATQEYNHYNTSLKNELPHLIALTTAFITPLFQTFYYIQVSILYTLLSSIQGFTAEKYGELPIEHLEDMYNDRLGDAAERLAELGLTKRFVGTARLMSAHRQGSSDSASVASSSYVPTSRPPPPSSSGSYSSSAPTKAPYRSSLPPAAPAASYEPAPPPYIPSTISPAPTGAKRAPPPPPAPKPRPAAPKPKLVYVTALYDYAATAEGDLSFSAGDRIELIKRGESAEDWWTGRLEAGGEEGVFPGNYVQA